LSPINTETVIGGETFGNNSAVLPVLTSDRQQLSARVVCRGCSTNGDAQINGYATAQDVAIVIDSVEH
jgi:hypothetical protein